MDEIIVFLLVVVSLCNSLNIGLQNSFNLKKSARFFSNRIGSFAASRFLFFVSIGLFFLWVK